MQTIVNKTFKEIVAGDAATVQHTLQVGDVRAWAAAFGEVDMLAGQGESQAAAGVVTAILTAPGRFRSADLGSTSWTATMRRTFQLIAGLPASFTAGGHTCASCKSWYLGSVDGGCSSRSA